MKLLLIIFFVASILRFLYFPGSVYFGNDQARDAYYSYEVINGDFKIVGPGASFNNYIHHGVWYYYIMGPVYFLASGNPYVPAFLIGILSALGVFVVYFIGQGMFNKKVGLLAAFLYTVSFEQIQYALFFSHPSPALIFVLLYYLGLTKYIFKKDQRGIILASFSAGAAIQFHFSLIFLVLILPIFITLFKPKKLILKLTTILLALVAFGFTITTFIVAEIKFAHIRSMFAHFGEAGGSNLGIHLNNLLHSIDRYFSHNILTLDIPILSLILTILIFGFLIKKERKKGLFLLLWFSLGLIAYLIGDSTTYYYGIGASVSLLISIAFIFSLLLEKNRELVITLLIAIFVSNLSLITKQNVKGPLDSVMAPPGLLLSDELRAIDYIYTQANGSEFSVHGITIPFNVKSTWDYLFNWYGMKKYGLVPVWGGEDALGSEGTMVVVRARSELPQKQFLIIEPLSGLDEKVVQNVLEEESYFTHFVKEEKFGAITVQVREKY